MGKCRKFSIAIKSVDIIFIVLVLYIQFAEQIGTLVEFNVQFMQLNLELCATMPMIIGDGYTQTTKKNL